MAIREVFNRLGQKIADEEYTPADPIDTRIPVEIIEGLERVAQLKLPPVDRFDGLPDDAPEALAGMTTLALARQEMERINRRYNRVARVINQLAAWMRSNGIQKEV